MGVYLSCDIGDVFAVYENGEIYICQRWMVNRRTRRRGAVWKFRRRFRDYELVRVLRLGRWETADCNASLLPCYGQ